MVSVWTNLRKVFQMLLTSRAFNHKICLVKAMAYNSLQVNEGNVKNPCSLVRSPSKLMNFKAITTKGERENNFPRAYVGNYFLFLITFFQFLLRLLLIIFFNLLRACIFLFTHSLLIKLNLKTIVYKVNEIKIIFTLHSLVHLKG